LRRNLGDRARLVRRNRLCDRRDVIRRRATAAADNIDETRAGELADQLGHEFRAFVVISELIEQAGIRIGADEAVGDAADLLDMRAHFLGAERAVEPDGHRPSVRYRIPERGRRLARQPRLATPGELDAVRLAGPSAPATKRFPPPSPSASFAASRARRAKRRMM